MKPKARRLRDFLAASRNIALVEVIEAKGSTPREVATWMLVSRDAIFGTIGGGQLEFMAIARAREMIEQNVETTRLDVPLGPEIGQCCGGHVKLYLVLLDEELREAIPQRISFEEEIQPHVYLFGGGHVGHALAQALALLPLTVAMVETRPEELLGAPEGVRTIATAVPEEIVRGAPAGSAFVILTHDHALDFLIVSEALGRNDAAYVGMIGSKTKKATFKSWYLREAGGGEEAFDKLVCPIGGSSVKDKRPSVIAALVSAELLHFLPGERQI
ncbi:xanthine dehydrogenase accessory protein XdhC [Aquamicrobium zhengzhouense]|uniref:Xanthine dehydrogenase accessory protein XdhC n=1 Tax=Aquamicrobium zhengzhouense TaxID=2781738 RepID=A0ABS0SIR9_9HYPH|nr:xanthine dehydrogenase accessory protein XdhC [Aquamicrobium zhengzhouense]MBI1622487.1 xanthine dehydrogenase accessory protein XdhC [Aquamicrobium zhengzhouense]